jgi:hypothetical protein
MRLQMWLVSRDARVAIASLDLVQTNSTPNPGTIRDQRLRWSSHARTYANRKCRRPDIFVFWTTGSMNARCLIASLTPRHWTCIAVSISKQLRHCKVSDEAPSCAAIHLKIYIRGRRHHVMDAGPIENTQKPRVPCQHLPDLELPDPSSRLSTSNVPVSSVLICPGVLLAVETQLVACIAVAVWGPPGDSTVGPIPPHLRRL